MKKQHKLMSLVTALVMLTLLAVSALPTAAVSAAALPPEALSPIGVITDNTPTFRWKPATGTTGITGYRYVVYRNGITTPVFNKTPGTAAAHCTTELCWHTPNYAKNLKTGDYYWKVIAMKGNTNFGNWSDSVKFSISAPPISFYNSFNYEKAGWDVRNGSATWKYSATSYYTNGTINVPFKWSSVYYTKSQAYSNFVFDAVFRRSGSLTDPNCMDVRMGSTQVKDNYRWHTGYAFCVNNGGNFQVVRRNADKTFTNLIPWTPIPAVANFVPNDWNKVRVVAIDGNMWFLINKELVTHTPVYDKTFPIGWMGFEMYKSSSIGNRFEVNWATATVLRDSSQLDALLNSR